MKLESMIYSVKYYRNKILRVKHLAWMLDMAGGLDEEVCEVYDINYYLSAINHIVNQFNIDYY